MELLHETAVKVNFDALLKIDFDLHQIGVRHDSVIAIDRPGGETWSDNKKKIISHIHPTK